VWAALEKLPPAQRAAVVQRYYLGMSEAEMSEGGGSPPGTIKSRLYAARRRLSKLLRSQVGAGDAPESGERATPTGAPSYRSEEGRP
jgi:DNA-directed RNA polymerase specialized sigma24 family protein